MGTLVPRDKKVPSGLGMQGDPQQPRAQDLIGPVVCQEGQAINPSQGQERSVDVLPPG